MLKHPPGPPMTLGNMRALGVPDAREPDRQVMAMEFAIVIAMLLPATAALAEPLPIPHQRGPAGGCPAGYVWKGSYCVPFEGASQALPRPFGRACPYGWSASGSYCLRR
jgi:hypothetical protein